VTGASATPEPASAARMPKGRARRWGRKLALLAASLTVCLLALEVFVRIAWTDLRYVPRGALAPSGVYSARMKPDAEFDFEIADGDRFHVTTNARGFRGPTPGSIADRALRIVSIGDSFTFGWGLALEQHCMARFVEDHRRAHPDRDVGHAYVATCGWNPRDYAFAYRLEASAARPHVVVVGVLAENDVLPAGSPRFADPKDAPSTDALPGPPPRALFRSLDWARVQFGSSLPVARLRLWAGYHPSTFERFESDLARQEEAWSATFFYLDALDADVRRDGGRLVVLSYPSLFQVDAHEALDGAGYDHTMPDRVLGEHCRRRGVAFVPLLEDLKAANARRDLYFRKDRHLNVAGNGVAAAALSRRLAPVVDAAWGARSGR
jgi:hypothetical protein